MKKIFYAASLLFIISSCNKDAGSFSVLSETSTFEQKATFAARKLDVLFVVDNSGSMATSQTNLVNNFSSFIDRFISKGYDFKIAITTTEAYAFPQFGLGSAAKTKFRTGSNAVYVIDQSNYDLTQASERTRLKNDFTLNALVGTGGSGDERSLSSFKEALNFTDNAGFHRADAFLSVVIISDEEDFSQSSASTNETYTNPLIYPVSDYNTFLQTFTQGQPTTDYSVSSITVIDDACRVSLGGAQKISNRVLQLVDLTGGTKNSICAPFDTSLDNISAKIESQNVAEFVLPKAALVSSIRLVVDGNLIPQNNQEGWSYTAATRTVKIHGSIYKPKNGSLIKLNYDPDLNSL